MTFNETLEIKRSEVEEIITNFLPKQLSVTDEAMVYSVEAGGKRLRPLFLIAFYEAFSKIRYKNKPRDFKEMMDGFAACYAASLEFIHTYSLVHDDLPDMDNDMLRRGKPTTHARYGAAMGILAGDALLNQAFCVIADICRAAACLKDPEPIQRGTKAFKIMADCAGREGMILGQEIDLRNEGLTPDTDTLLMMYELKTSKLLEAAFCCGALLGGASDREVALCSKAARNLGIAFQIQDDILDVNGDEAKIGKPVKSDEKNGKHTYVYAVGLEKAISDAAYYTKEAVDALRELEPDLSFVIKLMHKLLERES